MCVCVTIGLRACYVLFFILRSVHFACHARMSLSRPWRRVSTVCGAVSVSLSHSLLFKTCPWHRVSTVSGVVSVSGLCLCLCDNRHFCWTRGRVLSLSFVGCSFTSLFMPDKAVFEQSVTSNVHRVWWRLRLCQNRYCLSVYMLRCFFVVAPHCPFE